MLLLPVNKYPIFLKMAPGEKLTGILVLLNMPMIKISTT
jgi:hypothetical protein